jgi:hypothetical protein
LIIYLSVSVILVVKKINTNVPKAISIPYNVGIKNIITINVIDNNIFTLGSNL